MLVTLWIVITRGLTCSRIACEAQLDLFQKPTKRLPIKIFSETNVMEQSKISEFAHILKGTSFYRSCQALPNEKKYHKNFTHIKYTTLLLSADIFITIQTLDYLWSPYFFFFYLLPPCSFLSIFRYPTFFSPLMQMKR